MEEKSMAARNHLSTNLSWLLEQHNLTTAELSRRCGVTQPVVHRLVVGTIENPQVHTLLPICDYFNCSVEAILKENFPKTRKTVHPGKTEVRHAMRNSLLVIHTLIQGLEKTLLILTQAYIALPKEFRTEEISDHLLLMLPKMLDHAIEATSKLRAAINNL